MTPAQCYCEYIAIKLHFSSSYNYFHYNGKTRATREAFESRPDVYYFDKLSRHYDPRGLLVAHLAENPEIWIGDILANEDPYLKQQKIIGALPRFFEEDLKVFKDGIDTILQSRPYQLPGLLQLYLCDDISLPTVSIINDITHVVDVWRKGSKNAAFIEPFCQRFEKYQPFLEKIAPVKYSRQDFIEIVKNFFNKKT